MLEKGMDVFSLFDMLFSSGFAGGIDIGCTHDDLPERVELLKDRPGILIAGAMGPWEAGKSESRPLHEDADFTKEKSLETIEGELGILRKNIERYKARFVGEIGLDYYWEYGNHDKQHLIFESQMEFADRTGRCVLIHDRDADEGICNVIRRKGPSKGGVIHCFDGSPVVLETALSRGYFISFAGNLTYKSNINLRQMLKRVPKNRILMETDAPYLSPVPLRGKTNSPAHIIHTYECAAEVLGISLEELKETVLSNSGNCARGESSARAAHTVFGAGVFFRTQ